MIVLKPTIIGFSASYLFFHGEGIMVLKPTIIGLSAIRPLSPWERVRERANRNNLRKRRLKKMTTQKYAVPKPPKEKYKKQLLPNTFQTTSSRQNGHASSEIRFPRYLKLGDSTWASSQFLRRLRSR